MCRILVVSSKRAEDPTSHLDQLKLLSENSPEYQGHGWGCAWLDDNNQWQLYHNIEPIWDDRSDFPPTRLFLAHARSAFKDEGIAIENNMPFYDGERVFIFNGELRGVRIKAEGRIGAEKIFNTVKRFDKGDFADAMRRGVKTINHRTRYVRAMNFIIASDKAVHYCSQFSENPDYFQLRETTLNDQKIICSQPYPMIGAQWQRMTNDTVGALNLH